MTSAPLTKYLLRDGTGRDTPFGGQGDDSRPVTSVPTPSLSTRRSADAMDTITNFEDGETIELKGFTYPGSFTTTVDGDLIITVDGMDIARVKDAASFFDLSDIAYD